MQTVSLRISDAGTVQEFVPSYCAGDPTELTTLTAPDLSGTYQDGDEFSTCRANEPALTQSFLDLCTYDYCENYLTSASDEQTFSACDPTDGGKITFSRIFTDLNCLVR